MAPTHTEQGEQGEFLIAGSSVFYPSKVSVSDGVVSSWSEVRNPNLVPDVQRKLLPHQITH